MDFLLDEFEAKFGTGREPEIYFAPGRVNLIGEHIDYNGGCVLPCAIDIGTYAAVRPRDDGKIFMYSMNFPECGIICAEVGKTPEDPGWGSYVSGVVRTILKIGKTEREGSLEKRTGLFEDTGFSYELDCLREGSFEIPGIGGFEMCVYGNIPNGSGLSSSASLEVLTGYIVSSLFDLNISKRDLAIIGMYAENVFCGVNCGIMDQFSIAAGRKDNAILLDTATLGYSYAPLSLPGVSIVIGCTNKIRKLGESKYNERRRECERALKLLSGYKPGIASLSELEPQDIEKAKDLFPDEVIMRRARHVITECSRTSEAVSMLEAGDLEGFGELMNESHRSLRDDYEVTGKELDAIVGAAWTQKSCLGSRMTGTGFGGCSVSLVRDEGVDAFIREVGAAYRKDIGYNADFYVVRAGDGPHRKL